MTGTIWEWIGSFVGHKKHPWSIFYLASHGKNVCGFYELACDLYMTS